MSEISFAIEGVLEDARQKTGLSDFGENDFMEGLQVLLETYDNNGYSERGRKRCRRRVVDLLAARLRIENAFKLHPEIRNEKINQPLFLTGLPRTGTSALLNLLAADPAARPLYMWEGFNPEPIEGLPKGAPDPRYEGMKAFEEEQKKNPEFAKIHATSVDTPEECIHLLNHTFCDVQFGVETMMEPYGSWFQKQDLRKSYAYYADLLRMIQWQRPGERWVLKTPGHLWALDILVELFPDCGIIITHRNPLESVASYCSMMANMMKQRESYDLHELGPVLLEYLARKLERGLQARSTMNPDRFIDIQFTDFVNNAVATAESIYAHFKLPFDDTVAKQLRDYDKAHPMNKHGKHEYSLAQYGLTEDQVLSRFDFYLQQYTINMD
ncbi:MAG: sulfotransferase [Pseudomonadales bacterium]|nr:sulfotransferase [Pseudomonadales bacterium]